MRLYRDYVLPRIMNVAMNTGPARSARARVCSGLAGDIVEIGFGSGLNLPHLPGDVTSVKAIEPAGRSWRLARRRIDDVSIPVSFAGLDGRQLPFESASTQAVLCTWTLCTIPDPVAALEEIRRVLTPGGALHFVEHGLSPDPSVATWQQRLNPVQRRLAGGCELARDVPALLRQAGFDIEQLDTYYQQHEPKTHGWTFEGIARPKT